MSTQKINPRGELTFTSVAVGFLTAVLVFSMFVVGYDQGQLFSMVEGQEAFDSKWIHEFTHDMRHAAGFPCH